MRENLKRMTLKQYNFAMSLKTNDITLAPQDICDDEQLKNTKLQQKLLKIIISPISLHN